MNKENMFVPSNAKLCARKKDNKIFSLYLSNGTKVVADRTFETVNGEEVLYVKATNVDDKGKVLSAFIYDDDADWNRLLEWCAKRGLLTDDEALDNMKEA
jgi:hypothetical protein